MNVIRKDYFLDRWVIFASERARRPEDFMSKAEIPKKGTCFFCPGNEHLTPPEIDRAGKKGGWTLRVFPNKFPATIPEISGARNSNQVPALGKHEIVVETPRHDGHLHELSVSHLVGLLDMYRERVDAIEKIRGVRYAMVFKNRGMTAGASLSHTHTQILGLPMVPKLVEEEARASRKKCPFCGIVKKESRTDRKIISDRHTLAMAPYASRFPFEVWILPRRHVRSIGEMTDKEKESFAKTMKRILTRLDHGLGFGPFNFYLHHSPKMENLHFHLEICPKLSIMAGFELGSGMYINTVTPEQAAKFYRGG